MQTELNFIDYIGLFAIIFLFVYTVVMSFVYKKRRKELLIKYGYAKRKFTPSYIEITGFNLFDRFKNIIRMVKIHINELTHFNIDEELRRFQIILNAQQPILTVEKQIQRISGWAFIITFITALFGNVPPNWDFITVVLLVFSFSKSYFDLKKYIVNVFNLKEVE